MAKEAPQECKSCGMPYRAGVEPDPCLGELPGVLEACCGHGRLEKGYVLFEDGTLLRGFRRIEYHDLNKKRRSGGGAKNTG
jgi:hypothetical protein